MPVFYETRSALNLKSLDEQVSRGSFLYCLFDLEGSKPVRQDTKTEWSRLGEDQLRVIIEAVPSGMIMVDRSGKIVLVNGQIERLFGYNRSELLGQSVDILVPNASRVQHPAHRESFFSDPRARAMGVGRDLFGLRKNGEQVPVEIGLNPVVIEKEQFVVASIVDITERKRAEDRLRLVIEAAPSGMLMVEKAGKIVLVNSQIERLFGYNRSELLGQPVEILVPVPSRDKHPGFRESFFAVPEARAMGVGRDLYGLRKDGTQVPVEIGLNPLVSQGESFVLASVVDISERKRTEQTIREKVIELQRSNEDLQQFAYVCSHDLQEPLRVIANYTQLLAKRYQGSLDDKGNQFIGFIVDATKRMQGLINDLLLYSRVQTRQQEFQDTNCEDAISAALSNLKMAIQESNAYVEYGKMPTIKGDVLQLTQLFQNLIGNAIKFRSEERPHVQIAAQNESGRWRFSVRDNGLGLDMKYADRIFVIFQRLHSKEAYPGSGIGLAICKKIVERHGGSIWAESEPGKGTTFVFELPQTSSAKRV